MKYDFVAFGDITTDAFIRLKDARTHCNINNENCELCVRFGDKIPYESVTEVRAVGNSPNAAVAVHRLGLASTVVTDLGDDRGGDDCIEALKQEGIPTEFVRVHPGAGTNYHYVLWYEAERTILVLHHEYPREFPQISEAPTWMYLSSLGAGTIDYQKAIAQFASEHGSKLVFQPGTFQINAGVEEFRTVYAATELFFCNKEEAKKIIGKDGDIKELIAGIHALGPKQVVITDGRGGAYPSDGSQAWHIPMYPDPAPPVDRTGAGDASTATTAAFLALGMTLPEAVQRGMINSMSVVQYVGAQAGLLSRDRIESYMQQAPAEFVATLL